MLYSRLEKSQLELHICGSVGADRWVDAAQFTRRLGIQPASSHAARLYQIFQQKSSGLVFFPDYLLCAAFLSLQHEPLSHLLAYAFKLYSSNGSGRLTQAQFVEAAGKCLALCQEDATNTFQQADVEERGTLTYDEFMQFASKKAEFAFLSTTDGAVGTKPKSQ
ncbi:hypothetical protein JYU34_020963 [Plutella xylostella]|uniref:EF-hand domain-containing protein n=1 Tax=Plutella xylostella TaxID=51655 RepID=A0ABQ7PTR2_PLUXY|nr:hypothetical protein JYU34_020963 [Plutella xylostella]